MMGKRLLITSTDLMMVQFLIPHVRNFAEHGYEVEIACSDVGGYAETLKKKLGNAVKAVYIVPLERSPFSLFNIKGFEQLKRIIVEGRYDIIWTNEPVMGAATRLAGKKARKNGTRIVYMVHGLHFYKGAPLINWLVFYPVEKLLSYMTDYIITVNQEDYVRVHRFPVKKVYYIHGIGADTARLKKETVSHNIRRKLDIPEDAFLVLSVGELNANKNQKVIIEALSLLADRDIYYVVCGSGKNLKALQAQAMKSHVEGQIRFVNYRRDIINFYDQADVFVLTSYREGLPVALLEAMYCGVPAVASDIRGVRDVMENEETGIVCAPDDSEAFAAAIKRLKEDLGLRKQYGENGRKAVTLYTLSSVKDTIINIFGSFGDGQE